MSIKLILKRLLDILIKRGYFDCTGFDKIVLIIPTCLPNYLKGNNLHAVRKRCFAEL